MTTDETTGDAGGVREGPGYAAAHLDDLGDGPGFRKVRQSLGVSAFGVNAIVIPPGIETGFHYHDVQEELYFVHSGEVEMEFDGGLIERLPAGSFVRVDAATVRRVRNTGSADAVYICVGGKDGYVGRDGRQPPGQEGRVSPISAS